MLILRQVSNIAIAQIISPLTAFLFPALDPRVLPGTPYIPAHLMP